MRVSTAFNRILQVPGAWVDTIEFTDAGIVVGASVQHGLSNSRLEGINAKIRLIDKRGYGHPYYESLTAMIHLCLGDITIPLPTET